MAEKTSYANRPDSSRGSELKAIEEPALSTVEGSKVRLLDSLESVFVIRVRLEVRGVSKERGRE